MSRLSTLFAKRVKNRLKSYLVKVIDNSNYTCGELVAKIIAEEVKLCNEIKLYKQLQNEKTQGIKAF